MRAITIDGPAAAGKTTTAKQVAKKLEYVYCDTGALYRTLAVGFLERGLEDAGIAEIETVLPKLKVTMEMSREGEQRMFLNGEDVTHRIRTEEVSNLSSVTSAIPSVRAHLKQIQRTLAREHDVVMEGRDIGTIILPQADMKFFLTADVNERAHRRQKYLAERGERVPFDSVLRDMQERDARDSSRAYAPLKPAPDAILVDNTNMNLEETIRLILRTIDLRTSTGDAEKLPFVAPDIPCAGW